MKRLMNLFLLVALTMVSVLPGFAAPNTTDEFKLVEKVRRELVTLPFFSVFDNFAFQYKDGVVTLQGQVTRPTLKSDAERVVARIAGVEQVVNNIEVLPLSPLDDRIRLATYRAVYGQPGLDRLAFQANPPVRIIVKNGNVTLEGVVLNEGDKTRAFLAANAVPNVFSVTNNLRTEIAKK
ncbi:MAG TPA: BON domain-containing protein [Blastocatellia bacterium]|nr:BON domain-containing protein [Blastocatellia bacterium]